MAWNLPPDANQQVFWRHLNCFEGGVFRPLRFAVLLIALMILMLLLRERGWLMSPVQTSPVQTSLFISSAAFVALAPSPGGQCAYKQFAYKQSSGVSA